MRSSFRWFVLACSPSLAGCAATCLNGGTAIDSVPYTIAKPGAYCLARTVQGKAGADGITIVASHVTVDMQGNALLGVGDAGHAISAQRSTANLAVFNGTIDGWGRTGLFAPNVTGGHYERLRVMSNKFDGMAVGSHSIVDQCTVGWNGTRETIEHNGQTAERGSGDGISIGHSSTVMNSIVFANVIDGIVVRDGGTVSRCTSEFNGRAGVWASNGGAVVTENVLQNNFFGVLASRTYNRIDDNEVRFNGTGIAALAFDSVTRNDTISNTTNITGGPNNGFGPKGAARTTSSPWANELH